MIPETHQERILRKEIERKKKKPVYLDCLNDELYCVNCGHCDGDW